MTSEQMKDLSYSIILQTPQRMITLHKVTKLSRLSGLNIYENYRTSDHTI
uniref:Uncharacterized protein n=1 Tax=Arion vulgaris TaxID=1028688 RepID=A0A0B6ZEA3_9EUPU